MDFDKDFLENLEKMFSKCYIMISLAGLILQWHIYVVPILK